MRLRIAACLATVAAATRPPVVVSGATGRVGSAVVRSLVSRRGSAEGVYVLARDAEKAQAMHEGVQCLCAAHDDAEALAEAFGSVPSGFRLFVACSNSPQQAVPRAACAARPTRLLTPLAVNRRGRPST